MVAKNSLSLPQSTDPHVKRALEKIAETVDTGSGLRGNPEERFIRVADLIDMGLAKRLASRAQALVSGVNLIANNAPIMDIPPAPTGFTVVGGLGLIFLNWDNARTAYGNHAYTEIWRAEEDNLSNAVLIQQDTSSFGSVDRGATYGVDYFYWVRFVSDSDIKGPFNAATGTEGKLAEDPAILLEMLTGEITASQLHPALNSRIDLIDAPGTGLVAQSTQNANNIINEAAARLSLAQQLRGDYTGSNLSELTTGLLRQETVTREASINQLSSQMALLTAGSASQFDHSEAWYFDSSIESWTGNGTPSIVNSGWLRPAVHASNPYVRSPTVAIDGTKYTQVRARIKKVGSPTWDGALRFITTIDSTWDSAKQVVIAEPGYESGIANVTFTVELASWIGKTITAIQIDLSTSSDTSNYFEIDWLAIGRPAPGASSAELFEEQLARINADNALSSSITAANSAIAGKASQSSVDSLTSRVTTAEGTITTQGNKLTAIDSQLGATSLLVNPNFSVWTNAGSYPDSWSAWDGTGLSRLSYSGGYAVQYAAVAGSNSGFRQDINQNLEYLDFELVFNLNSGSLSGAGLHVEWVNTLNVAHIATVNLKDLYTPADIYNKKIVCKARVKRPAGFSGTFSTLRVYVMANYAGSSLGATSTKTIVFYNVLASMPDASANAIQSLDSRVTSAEGSLSSQSSQLTQLRNNIALNTNALDTTTWVSGSTGSQGTPGQQGYWEANGYSTENKIVTAGNSGVPVGPFGGSDVMWECKDAGDGAGSGGYNVALAPNNKIAMQRGAVFATFFRHNGVTNGNIYHGTAFSGVVDMAGTADGNPYFIAHGVVNFVANRWYLLYGVLHPRGSQISDTGLSGVYDCTTGERVTDGAEFRMGSDWDSSLQTFRNYLFYSTDTVHKVWFARPLVTPLDVAPTPHQLMAFDSRTYANSQAIGSISSQVTSISGQVTAQGNSILSLQNDVAGKASSSALNLLSSRVDAAEGVNTSQANAISQISASIPGGGNLLPDSEFLGGGTGGWLAWNQGGGAFTFAKNLAGTDWTPVGYNQIGMVRFGAQTGVMHIYSPLIPCTPATRYCFSANISGHRCTLRLIIEWYTSSQAYITETQNGSWSQGGGTDIANGWNRREVFGNAPANARWSRAVFRAEDNGNNDEYMWLCRPMFSEVPANTTVAPPYTPATYSAHAAISEEASVRASTDGAIMAQKFIKLDVNGKIAGYGAMNNGVESIMEFAFDKVAFYSPGKQSFSLIVEGDKVVMDGAFMKTASITSAAIDSLAVNKLVGDTANFVKLNVGTLVVDDIQGDVSGVYHSGAITSAFDFGGIQVAVVNISVPQRTNSRGFGLQFFVQGSAVKALSGFANIQADFFEPNASSSVISTHTINTSYFNQNTTYGSFGCVVVQPTGSPDRTPADWASIQVGDVLCLYLNSTNFIEGVVESKVSHFSSPGPGVEARGTYFVLKKVAAIGSVPYNGSGCQLQRRSEAGRFYRQLAITMSAPVYTATANQPITYNMSYYDVTNRLGSARTILCTIAMRNGSGSCTNSSINFAVVAGR